MDMVRNNTVYTGPASTSQAFKHIKVCKKTTTHTITPPTAWIVDAGRMDWTHAFMLFTANSDPAI